MTRRVLVTGAAGNLGRKACAALAGLDDVAVVGIDEREVDDLGPGVEPVAADLSNDAEAWTERFHGVDVVLHLAAEPRPIATWESVLRSNVAVSQHVLRAADEHGVPRVVFASSNWVLGGYRFTHDRLTPATPPRPVNAYGVSKLVTEHDGAVVSARTGMAFLALRIGWCQPGENRPGPQMSFGRWGQELWLSNDDWRQAVQLACTTPFEGSAVVNVMSANDGMRWDLTDTRRVLGYEPTSHHVPRLDARTRITDELARWRARGASPFAGRTRVGERW
jgi:nucleoside-diphosphate-sugar epimerase